MESLDQRGDLICHRCGAALASGEGSFWIVRIEAVADPSPPAFDEEDDPIDIADQWERLIEQMRHQSEQELVDQVYRKLTLHLCAACFRGWIESPAG